MIEFVRDRTCIRCFQCVAACPCDVIQAMYDGGYGHARVHIGYPDDCMSCQLCVVVCESTDNDSPSGKPIYVGPERSYRAVLPW